MSILDRLNRLIRSNIGDGSGRTSDTNLRSALEEMEKSLREARRRQAEMRRSERELVDSIREKRDEADEWEERAMLALQNGDEDLAREALKVKNEAIRRADKLREELREHRSHMEDIQASLEAMETKLQSQKERLTDERSAQRETDRPRTRDWDRKLEERRTEDADDAAEPATPQDDAFRTDDTFETFDRMAGKIDAMEAEIEAMRELSGDGGESKRARLERIFRKMEGQSDRRRADSESDQRPEQGQKERRGRDNLAEKKRRMDRLSELKDKFGEDDNEEDS